LTSEAPLWIPSRERVAAANLTRFAAAAAARHGFAPPDYATLHRWSIEDPAAFWQELARFADVQADWGAGPALEHAERMPGARFFPAARLNFAENLLRCRDDREALVFVGESGARRALTFRQLHAEVGRIAQGLRDCGIVPGDRVAAFMPNIPETIVAMLAATSLGATWSSCSPDFGINGVLDRFGQIAPKVLFTADGYHYAGKAIDSLGPMARVLERLTSVERVIVVPYRGTAAEPASRAAGRPALAGAVPWAEFGQPGAEPAFARLPFAHPLYILYSSGTTGVPKCIVHGAGGTLLQHRKEHLLHTDLGPDDRLFYFTTCGWMMWNWLASGLAGGATLVLFDGSPLHPDPGVLWRLAERERVSVFGTSARYIASLEKSGYRPREQVRLPALRAVLSTGSPLAPESFDFVYRDVAPDVHLASISGGTDIVSCFMLGNPTLPVRRGEIQCAGLGMAVEVWDDDGHPVTAGGRGELVCTRPFPSMPIGFWNDPDGARYRAAYFERFPGAWHHGDYCSRTAGGGFVIHGRSDAVLNPGGVRIGTAEIYRQVETLPEVLDAVCIGQEWQHDVRVVLFVKLRDGVTLDEPLQRRIRDAIRAGTTPRHVPARIVAVPEVPRTLSGKVVELAVRNVVHGLPVRNTDALANPEALAHFRDRAELSS
jgi:acetoacetyl-CoA synthetase